MPYIWPKGGITIVLQHSSYMPGNKNLGKMYGFKKGDPRINRKGRPKVMPAMRALMDALLAPEDGEDITTSKIAEVVKTLMDELNNKKLGNQRVAAAKELLDRVYGKVKPVEDNIDKAPIVWQETKTYEKKKE